MVAATDELRSSHIDAAGKPGDDGLIVLPYAPRKKFNEYHFRQQRWAKIVAHRRFGKTVGCICDLVVRAAANERKSPPPRYAYVAPTYTQAKDVAWNYLRHYTAPLLDHGLKVSESELWVELPRNKARIRLYGADNYDRLRGLYLDGVTIDEPAQFDPRAWPEVIRPTLSDYNGWATFIGTPSGRDWFFRCDKLEDGSPAPDFFRLTLKASETGILPPDELESARRTLSADQYAQEYECSFEAAIHGAFYARELDRMQDEQRVCRVPIERSIPVYTAWDLGISDSTAIWFIQIVGKEIRLIDYHEASGVGFDEYARVLKSKNYVYAEHYFPHDVAVHELSTGVSRVETLRGLGIEAMVVPQANVMDGIGAVRRMLDRCWLDEVRCSRGWEALRQYRREWDDKLHDFKMRPLHDWCSHGADALRTFAAGYVEPQIGRPRDRYRARETPKTTWMSA